MRGYAQLQLEVPPPEWYDHVVASPSVEPEQRGVLIIPLLPEDEDEAVVINDSTMRQEQSLRDAQRPLDVEPA
jgi:hypothetical protein